MPRKILDSVSEYLKSWCAFLFRSPRKPMKHNIFISYAKEDTDIVENLRGHFNKYGIKAWVYSLDRTAAEEVWEEIKAKIMESDLVIFVVSENTRNSSGQKREFELAFKKVSDFSPTAKIMPIFINGTDPSVAPDELRRKKCFFLNGSTVNAVAFNIG